jgi:hypothetical protein
MHDACSYVTVGGGPSRARNVALAARDAGGVVVGAWSGLGGIGWWDHEATLLIGWPGGSAEPLATSHSEHEERLHATARPAAIEPLDTGGVFAHRWFEIASDDWNEFLALSTEAWPAFEAAYGATIEGFYRSDDAAPPNARVLLITRYPSMAAWEASRGALRDPSGDVADSGRRFLRRRELTKRSIVRTAALLTLP